MDDQQRQTKIEDQLKADQYDKQKTRWEEYQKSNRWKNLKEKVIQKQRGYCEGCGEHFNDKKAINEMVMWHKNDKKIGVELISDMGLSCKECHRKETGHYNKNEIEWHNYISLKTDEMPKDEKYENILYQEEDFVIPK